jgi:hypothetical protein
VSDPIPVYVGAKPMSVLARVSLVAFCLVALLVTGFTHFATYFGVAFVRLDSGLLWLAWVFFVGWIGCYRRSVADEWEPPLSFSRIPARAFDMGLPRWAVWLRRLTTVYLVVLVVLNMVYLVEAGPRARCESKDGGCVLAGGGFTQKVTRVECEAHEATLLRMWVAFPFYFALVFTLDATLRRSTRRKPRP